MAHSLSIVSTLSSLEKLFDKEMFQNLYIMNDMVQEMYEDKRESIILQVHDCREGGEERVS